MDSTETVLNYVNISYNGSSKNTLWEDFKMSDKRLDYISWDEYFMSIAKLAGMRSKDPNSQVGA